MKVNALKELIQRIDGKKEDSFCVILLKFCTYSNTSPLWYQFAWQHVLYRVYRNYFIVENFYRRSSRRSTQSPSFLLVACNAGVLLGSASKRYKLAIAAMFDFGESGQGENVDHPLGRNFSLSPTSGLRI